MIRMLIKKILDKWEMGRLPNAHLPAESSRLKRIDDDVRAFIRPCFSDWVRICEFKKKIYVPDNILTGRVQVCGPAVIFDIGANIGLSSLAILKSFPTVKMIVGVEAEKENYLMLAKNYSYWAKETGAFCKLLAVPYYAIAASTNEDCSPLLTVERLPEGRSASGTFSFLHGDSNLAPQVGSVLSGIDFSRKKISLGELYDRHLNEGDVAIVKIDIEGGEEELFSNNTEWLDRTAFLTLEIHDRMGFVNASRNLLRALAARDFAIVPDEDVLHCYNRKYM